VPTFVVGRRMVGGSSVRGTGYVGTEMEDFLFSCLRREVGLLKVTGICGAVIETYVLLSLDRFERHQHLFWFLN